jgi:4-carboxymuconolactone decarboxylase
VCLDEGQAGVVSAFCDPHHFVRRTCGGADHHAPRQLFASLQFGEQRFNLVGAINSCEIDRPGHHVGDRLRHAANVINAYVYGDVWERAGLSDSVRSLVMLGITAASNKPAEFAVHAKGALANGCTRAQVQDVLLLVAMYCGIPAAIETNRIAAEIFGQNVPSPDAAKS